MGEIKILLLLIMFATDSLHNYSEKKQGYRKPGVKILHYTTFIDMCSVEPEDKTVAHNTC